MQGEKQTGLNWKLMIFDVLILVYLFINIYDWDNQSELKKFVHQILGISWLARQVYEHISFYKKARRFY